MQKVLLLNVVAVVLVFSSCSNDMVRGGGSTSTRAMSLAAFTAEESHYNIRAHDLIWI